MNAQIMLIDGQYSLVHISLHLYSSLLQPILRMLLPSGVPCNNSPEDTGNLAARLSPFDKHGFLNISITPVECSVICHAAWAREVFQPVIFGLPTEAQKHVSISRDSYMVFSVSSASMEAGQRVIDLSAPLAMAGISIFFITTYYTDFILVPSKDHLTVVQALLARGFEVLGSNSAHVSPETVSHARGGPSSKPPSMSPPSNIAELQERTLSHLREKNVMPFVCPNLRLVQCSGRATGSTSSYSPRLHSDSFGSKGDVHRSHWLDNIDSKLYMGLMSTLVFQPRFLSVTLSKDDAPSLLLDKASLPFFGDSIAGDTDGDLVPIFLDLSNLPLESSGIICGVASKLVEELRARGLPESELSYLSTAWAGALVLSSQRADQAVETLMPLFKD